jgi:ferredoxin
MRMTMAYQGLACYFLSGTGNSFRAARWLVEAAEQRGTAALAIPIDRAQPKTELRPGPDQLVGIYHPAHGLMPPWSMIKFLFRLPRGRGAHAVVVATRGGIRVGPVVLPGGAGWGVLFPLLILALKGYRVRAGLGIDMPINLNNLHWGLKPHNIEFIKAWGRKRHQRLIDAVLDGRRYFSAINLIWEALWAGLLAWLYPLFPLAYLLVGRLSMAKMTFADTRCKGCGVCAKICPNHAIVMKAKRPFWTHHCEACMRCSGFCKSQAVEASHIWMAVMIMAASLATSAALTPLFTSPPQGLLPNLTWQTVSFLCAYIAMPLLYYVFWASQRLRPLHVAWSYLTWTRAFHRRFRDPETKLKELL